MDIISIYYDSMNKEIKQRLKWIELYEETNNAGLVCRRCGISRPTLRKWYKRYKEKGLDGLQDVSRRPHNSPNTKIDNRIEEWNLSLRKDRKLGARRIQNELLREHNFNLSLASIHKVLTKHEVKPVVFQRKKKDFIRYQRPIPGDRVQMDTCKIAPGIYQYTSVDDCSRYRVLDVFKRRTAANTLAFIDKVIEEMPFPIQRVQTDRGMEFFAEKVQLKLMEHGIKFRPNKPSSPHLNGKVERSQRADKEEFYSTVNLDLEELKNKTLPEWRHYYNWQRAHGSFKGKTPMDIVCERLEQTPLWEDVHANYETEKERIQLSNYQRDLQLRKMK
jgi:transposase InsO family protein|tara:strand:- start:33 stop:1028 length:996 start_codon:yes stop_codon:yes gene_type:complete